VANLDQWCFSWFAGSVLSPGKDRASLMRCNKWNTNSRITVSFLNGDPALRERVRAVAQTWLGTGLANLKLSFQNSTDSMIRISFDRPGSWSVIGTTCLKVKSQSEPTMNFGWLKPDSAQEDVDRVVLHEFGHALGLIHEHQNPNNPIQWDRDAVIADLNNGKNPWTLPQIEQNMFQAYNRTETNSSKFDAQSIMLYPIPARWTKDGYSVALNRSLSAVDKSFIHQQYP
jgi:serralysin